METPRYIYRNSGNTGWVLRWPVRLIERLAGLGRAEKAVSCFADNHYGGRENALKIAVLKRDADFSAAGMNPDIVTKSRSNQGSVTGLLGVVPGYRKSRSNGFAYVSRWYALERLDKRAFSVSRFGMKEAFRLAVAHRERLTGVPFTLSQVKCALRVVREMRKKP